MPRYFASKPRTLWSAGGRTSRRRRGARGQIWRAGATSSWSGGTAHKVYHEFPIPILVTEEMSISAQAYGSCVVDTHFCIFICLEVTRRKAIIHYINVKDPKKGQWWRENRTYLTKSRHPKNKKNKKICTPTKKIMFSGSTITIIFYRKWFHKCEIQKLPLQQPQEISVNADRYRQIT